MRKQEDLEKIRDMYATFSNKSLNEIAITNVEEQLENPD